MSDSQSSRSGPDIATDPTRPRLRAIEHFTHEDDGDSCLVLRDPAGYVTDPVAVHPAAGLLLQYFDGRHTAPQIAARLGAEHGVTVEVEGIEHLARALDERGFLDSPCFLTLKGQANASYRALAARPPALAGLSYPEDPDALRRELDARFDGVSPSPRSQPPRAVIAPHIDMRVAERTYAHAYRSFIGGRNRPDLFVVLATAHAYTTELFTASGVPYETPLGPVPGDRAFLSALAAAYPHDLFADEQVHRLEHSVEFQAVHLRYLFGEDVPPMVPILTGSLERVVPADGDPAREPTISAFLHALRTAARDLGRRVCVIAGGDLSHLGPRFDDPDPLTDPALAHLAQRDAATLSAIESGDAHAFFRSVMGDGNQRRICGLTPIYLTLSWAEGRSAAVAGYRQWVEDGSVVTFAAAEIHG